MDHEGVRCVVLNDAYWESSKFSKLDIWQITGKGESCLFKPWLNFISPKCELCPNCYFHWLNNLDVHKGKGAIFRLSSPLQPLLLAECLFLKAERHSGCTGQVQTPTPPLQTEEALISVNDLINVIHQLIGESLAGIELQDS